MVDMKSMYDKLKVFGFDVYDVDGHNPRSIKDAFLYSRCGKPVALIMHTIRGFGSKTLMENDVWFHKAPNQEELYILQKEVDEF